MRQLTARAWMTGVVLLLGLLIAGSRLVYLQIYQAPDLQARAQAQQKAYLRPFIPRRSIVDRRSILNQQAELLAVDQPAYTLWAHPLALFKKRTPNEIAEILAPILQKPQDQLLEQLNTGQKTAIRLERWVAMEVADQIQELRIDGLELVSERQRIYPQKEMAAEVVGYVDLDHQGQAGLEYSQQEILERTVQPLTVPRDGYGQLLAAEVPERLLQSNESVLQLTLDMRLQRVARSALKSKITEYNAARGAVIVMEPRSGEILAMVSEPTYDPNRYYDGYEPGIFRNWAVTDLYEPGSTFKPINVALALEAGAIQANTRVYDEGRITMGRWPIQNYDYAQRGARGWLTVGEILKQSSNVGMVHLMQQMNPRQYYDALIKLGMNQPSGVDLPFEPASQLKSMQQFTRIAIERATTSFGQGFALTPLQLATFHCAIANGGFQVTPHVVRGLAEKDTDTLVWQPALPEPVPLFSETTTRAVRVMMRDVVDYGTGEIARIEGYEIAGKTGTAQKAGSNGGYIPGKRITSFVAYFPAVHPDYVILAVVDDPKGDDAYGSTVAAPIVRLIIQEMIAIDGIMPSS
jgi:cell division protein FtsI (penicillin-binding protein 3)